MTRRAFAGKQELTPPSARLDQRANLSPCSPHEPHEFLAKKTNFTSFMPQGHAAAPIKQAMAGRAKQKPSQQKARQMPGFSIFGDFIYLYIANLASAVNAVL